MLHVHCRSVSSHHITEEIVRKKMWVLQEKCNKSSQTYAQDVVLCLFYQLRLNRSNFALNSFQTVLLCSSGCPITQVLLFYSLHPLMLSLLNYINAY